MCGLSQTSKHVYKQLCTHLSRYEYYSSRKTISLWLHKTKSILLLLVINDFGIIFDKLGDTYRLTNILKQKYQIAEDLAETQCCCVTLEYDYVVRTVVILIVGYINKALLQIH